MQWRFRCAGVKKGLGFKLGGLGFSAGVGRVEFVGGVGRVQQQGGGSSTGVGVAEPPCVVVTLFSPPCVVASHFSPLTTRAPLPPFGCTAHAIADPLFASLISTPLKPAPPPGIPPAATPTPHLNPVFTSQATPPHPPSTHP